MDVSSPGCLLYLLVSGQDPSIADIVGDGVVEEHRVLGHHPNVSTQRSLLHLRGRGEGSGTLTPNAKIPPKPNPALSHEPHSLQAMCCRVALHHRLSCISILQWGALTVPWTFPGSHDQYPTFRPGVLESRHSATSGTAVSLQKGCGGCMLTPALGRCWCLH